MLRHKNRMSSHWGLLSVVWNNCRSKPPTYKVSSMLTNSIHTFIFDVLLVLFGQMKLCPK